MAMVMAAAPRLEMLCRQLCHDSHQHYTQPAAASCGRKPRARDLGVPFPGVPGRTNTIVDVAGVAVGHTTLVLGEGAEAVRTGVTAILPRGSASEQHCHSGVFSMNGCGEMTGFLWVEESGVATGPYMLTGTGSVGLVHSAT